MIFLLFSILYQNLEQKRDKFSILICYFDLKEIFILLIDEIIGVILFIIRAKKISREKHI